MVSVLGFEDTLDQPLSFPKDSSQRGGSARHGSESRAVTLYVLLFNGGRTGPISRDGEVPGTAGASQDREVDLEPTSMLSGCYDRLMAACPVRTQGGHFSLPLVPGRAWVAPAPGVCCERTGDKTNQCRGFQMVGAGAWGSGGRLRAAVRGSRSGGGGAWAPEFSPPPLRAAPLPSVLNIVALGDRTCRELCSLEGAIPTCRPPRPKCPGPQFHLCFLI